MILKYPDVNQIKRCALRGMASADASLNAIVLKGGNAIDLVHDRGTRASIDLDFSIAADFSNLEAVQGILEVNIAKEFRSELKLVRVLKWGLDFETLATDCPAGD